MFTKALCALTLIRAALAAPSGDWHGQEIHVKAGESIQAAVDKAKSGDCIVVGAGTYYEQVTISISDLSVRGYGAVLRVPKSPATNSCSGLAGPNTEAGICVTGSNVALADFVEEHRKVLSVGGYVQGVSVEGFEVHGFGLDIAVVGGQDTKVTKNTLYDGGPYGFLAVGSKNTLAVENRVATTGDIFFIGMCMDDTSPARYEGNHVSGYLIAYCLQTADAIIKGNIADGNCVGAFLDPGISGINFIDNTITNLDPRCPPSSPAFSTGGIVIFGASNAKISGNTIVGMEGYGNATGILLADAPGELASGNRIVGNVLKDNDLDILLFTNATDNVVKWNQCKTSFPAGLCT